jgi:pimeloyl-ACP methyl ester carboxylesterase
MLSHKEWEPIVDSLTDRFRIVLPDLPLHGDSEHDRRHGYTPDWFADVISGFASEVLGPRPLIGGHGLGAEIVLRAVTTGKLAPERIALMPNRMHSRPTRDGWRRAWSIAARAALVPGLDLLLSHCVRLVIRPELGRKLSARGAPEAVDLVRHAFADVGGNAELARSWARFAARWPGAPQRQLLDAYPALDLPVLLLWADSDPAHPLALAEEVLARLPHGQLRVLPQTGYLIAYDDPVGVARELAAWFG